MDNVANRKLHNHSENQILKMDFLRHNPTDLYHNQLRLMEKERPMDLG